MKDIAPLEKRNKKVTKESLDLFKFSLCNNDKVEVTVYGWNENAIYLNEKIKSKKVTNFFL